jgi:hypothetical protein
MAIFAILPPMPVPQLDAAIRQTYRDNYLQVAPNQWLVSASATAKEVSDQLGISDGKNGSAIVLRVTSYYGRAPTNIWEWIAQKLESKPGG